MGGGAVGEIVIFCSVISYTYILRLGFLFGCTFLFLFSLRVCEVCLSRLEFI